MSTTTSKVSGAEPSGKPGAVQRLADKAAIFLLALGLGGCQTASEQPVEEMIWVRADGLRATAGSELTAKFRLSLEVCLNSAQAAGITASAAAWRPDFHGGLIAGAVGRSVGWSTVRACMAERGYLWRTVAEAAQIVAERESSQARQLSRR